MAEGLDGIIATATRLSDVDGEAGRLTIAGYAIEDLAPYASFEEVAYLLLHGRLPEPAERVRFTQDLAQRRVLSHAALHHSRPSTTSRLATLSGRRNAQATRGQSRVVVHFVCIFPAARCNLLEMNTLEEI
jgi:citrate synthase